MSSLIVSGSTFAADNAALVDKPVRVQVSGVAGGAPPGKLISIEGCLYVQFDQKTNKGFTSVRLDRVMSRSLSPERHQPIAASDAGGRAEEERRRRERLPSALQISTSSSRLIHRV